MDLQQDITQFVTALLDDMVLVSASLARSTCQSAVREMDSSTVLDVIGRRKRPGGGLCDRLQIAERAYPSWAIWGVVVQLPIAGTTDYVSAHGSDEGPE